LSLRRLAGWAVRTRRALFPSPEERAWRRAVAWAGRVPRYRPGTIPMAGITLRYPDLLTLCPQWQDLFVRQSLRFVARTPTPRILDGGANIGLASLYFKRLYPGARITAFEADPAIAEMARKNLAANGAADVELVHAALWTASGTVPFRAEGADSGAVAELAGAPAGREITVPSLRLADLLAAGPVDLLKLDIEGAEEAVLPDAEEHLGNVAGLVMEIHETDPARRRTPPLLELLTRAGFHYTLDELIPLDEPISLDAPIPGDDGPGPAVLAPSPFPGGSWRWVIRVRAWRG